MKTRTLLLLALVCGVSILLAGGVMLVQLTGESAVDEPIALGATTLVGDMSVTVEEAVETAGRLDVTVRIGGVDDDDGAAGFRLIASARPVSPIHTARGGVCGATTLAEQTCLVRFDVSGADGASRVLLYERGDERARWLLG